MKIPKDIINLVENVGWLVSYFREFMLEYCVRNVIREADEIAKKTHM